MDKQGTYGQLGNVVRTSQGLGGRPDPPSMGGVQSRLMEQAKGLSEVHTIISQLEQRLRPVSDSNPPTPTGVDGMSKQATEAIQVINVLESHNSSLQAVAGRLVDLINRLHV